MSNQILFVFSGQGSQWEEMGRDLFFHSPEFRKVIDEIDLLFQPKLGWSIVDEMSQKAESSNVLTSSIAQPLIFSLQIGIIELLKQWGIQPNAIIGHSVGEVAAAYCAGVLTLEDAIDIIVAQNKLLQKAEGNGAMLFVALEVSQTKDQLTDFQKSVAVAAVNSPDSCVLSGNANDLEILQKRFEKQGIFTRMLAIDIPFHSPLIQEYLEDLMNDLPVITSSDPVIPIFSTLTGNVHEPGNYEQTYWVNHIKDPVLFAKAVLNAGNDKKTTFIEIGPHPVLTGSIVEIMQYANQKEHVFLHTLKRGQNAMEELLQLLAELDLNGHNIDQTNLAPEELDSIISYKEQLEARKKTELLLLNLNQASAQERSNALTDFIITTIKTLTLGKVVVNREETSGFLEMGIDSLTSVRIKTEIEKTTRLKLSGTLLFDYPNLDRLTSYLLSEMEATDVTEENLSEPEDAFDAVTNPIAIVGMSCRFPGGANSTDQFWNLLLTGENAISDVPADRWDLSRYYSEDESAKGKSYVKSGGFLKGVNIREFDADFFRITPKEAKSLDPQQKMLLEVVWESLENAGINPETIQGKNVGVYLGISTDDYKRVHLTANGMDKIDMYSATGTVFSAAGGRISFFLGLEGPNISVDTACSSSLVAMHLASQAMRAGECDMAIVAGVNGIFTPNFHVYFSKLKAISPDGICRSFDDNANGYVRSEGCGAIVLQKWNDALREENEILAIVKGTAVNQDGASSGFTAPNGIAQQKVVQKALRNASLKPSDITYVEAHGTGTPLGDPIEIGALAEVLGKGRTTENRLLLGSVKSNIGHMESAAGMGSLMKAALAIRHKTIPRNLHFTVPNSRIDWEQSGIKVVSENTILPQTEMPFTVGISGFGFSGTNAHVILQEPVMARQERAKPLNKQHLLCLSAKCQDGLYASVRQYIDYLSSTEEEIGAICFASQTRKAHFSHRLSVVGETIPELIEKLRQLLDNRPANGKQVPKSRKTVFLFTGQGAQYPGMGKELYRTNRLFKQQMDACDGVFQQLTGQSLLELIYGAEASVETLQETRYTQPALFAFEYALARWWMSIGVKPQAMIGHSVGEYVVACLAGVFTLEEGMRLITERGRLMYSLPLDGGMMAVFEPENRVQQLLNDFGSSLTVATVNSPVNTVISGTTTDIDLFEKYLNDLGIKCKKLVVSHAFHSALMDPILEEFKQIADTVDYQQPNIPIISNITGKYAGGSDLTGAEYWCNQLRMAVRYSNSIQLLDDDEYTTFIEVGPSPTLISMANQCVESPNYRWLPSFKTTDTGCQTLTESVGLWYETGENPDWRSFHDGNTYPKAILPTYPFQRKEHWMEPDLPMEKGTIQDGGVYHPFIGRKITSPAFPDTLIFESVFTPEQPAFLKEHLVLDQMISPAAAHLSMLLSFAKYGADRTGFTARDIQFVVPLAVGENERLNVQLIATNNKDEISDFQLVSKPELEDNWKKHCTGTFDWKEIRIAEPVRIEALNETYTDGMAASDFHNGLWNNGLLKLGSSFQRIDQIRTKKDGAFCRLIRLSDTEEADHYEIHPGMMDSILQSCIFASDEMVKRLMEGELFIPYGLSEMVYYDRPQTEHFWCQTSLNDISDEVLNGDIRVYNDQGDLLMEINGLTVKKVRESALFNALNQAGFQNLTYELSWSPLEIRHIKPAADHWYLIFSEKESDRLLQLEKTLSDSGSHYLICTGGTQTEKISEHHWRLQLKDKTSIEEMWKNLEIAPNPVSVIYLELEHPDDSNDVQHLRNELETNVSSVLNIAQQLIGSDKFKVAGFKLLTRNVHNTQPTNVYGSVLWGIGKSLMLEHPELHISLIDDCNGDGTLIEQLLLNRELQGLLKAEGKEVFEQKLLKTKKKQANATPEFQQEGVYLLTGGFGALGKQCAGWLIRQGCTHLALVGRDSSSPSAAATLNELRLELPEITAISCDIADSQQVTAMIEQLKSQYGTIKGIIHCAGMLDDGAFTQLTWDRFDSLFQAKVYGAWNLHQATLDQPLDFFVTYSSISSVFGNQGQANYAASNYFLDRFIAMRRSLGLPGTTINWGPWGESGMAAQADKKDLIAAKGLQNLDPEVCFEILAHVLTHPETDQLIAVKGNWSKYLTRIPQSARSFFDRIYHSTAAPVTEQRSNLADLIAKVNTAEIRPLILEFVTGTIKSILGYDANSQIDPDKSLTELGADSLMAVELRNILGKAIEKTLPISLLYNYPTINAIVDFMLSELHHNEIPEKKEEVVEATVSTSVEMADLDQMNEDDLLAFINSDLEG